MKLVSTTLLISLSFAMVMLVMVTMMAGVLVVTTMLVGASISLLVMLVVATVSVRPCEVLRREEQGTR